MEEKLYQVALSLVPGVGDVNAKLLISYSGSASAVFKSRKSLLEKIPGIGSKTIATIQNNSAVHEAEEILRNCEKHSISITHYTDSSYPKNLKSIADSPTVLYTKGNGSFNSARSLAVVGTRNATAYGKSITEKISEACARLKCTMISGLAYGIDIAAHRSSLNLGVINIAVLAGGLDKTYPSTHKSVAEDIMENGLLVSENPPGTNPDAHFFPARNRIIAGISDAVVVVEAAVKGGALITANIADSYDKPVFAVPGDLDNKYSEGCNLLIRNHKAYIYTGEEDLVYHLSWDSEKESAKTTKTLTFDHLSELEAKICNTLQKLGPSLTIDELAWKSQITINQLASLLLTLEFQGLIKSLPGKKYELC